MGAVADSGVHNELVQRIWRKDPAVWTDDPAAQRQIVGALGWLDLAETMVAQLPELEALAAEVREAGFTDVFLLGMGGSSLCPEVLRQTFGSAPGHPKLTVIDTTSPDAIRAFWRQAEPERTLFVVSSKSGGTTETACLFDFFYDEVRRRKGERAGEQFVVLTDPGSPLERQAAERKARRIVATPPDVGGRYSALTPFGLVPAALIGLDVRELLERARCQMAADGLPVAAVEPRASPAAGHPPFSALLGSSLGQQALRGRDKVTILAPPAIASFGLWAEQLLAESTGKDGRGLVPVAGEPVGPRDVYGDDRVFVAMLLEDGPNGSLEDDVRCLERDGVSHVRLHLADLSDLAAEFFRWELATAVAGSILRINPFDQPNVQESKDNTRAVLAEFEQSGSLPRPESASPEQVANFVHQGRAGDYVALMAYVPPTDAAGAALRELRVAIRDRARLATTVGYGPRFLHSTGQLHKGGPNTVLAVQLVSEPEEDLAIPGQPYTFGTLIQAQALGDLRSLAAHGRRAIRVDLGRDVVGGIEKLRWAIERRS